MILYQLLIHMLHQLLGSFCYFLYFFTLCHISEQELENVAIIAMYCHLRPPNAIAFPS